MEALLVLTNGVRKEKASVPEIGSLEHARTCYAHLAGWLGVQIADALQANGLLLPAGGRAFAVTQRGQEWFEELGVEVAVRRMERIRRWRGSASTGRAAAACGGCCGCGDVPEVRCAKWIVPAKNTRAVRVTLDGKRELWTRLRIAIR